ncbi:MAG: hypothetical protein ACOYNP_16650 [Gemmataceae bacterium]
MSFIICGTTASSNLVAVLPRPPPSDQFHNPTNATTTSPVAPIHRRHLCGGWQGLPVAFT